MFVLQGRGLGVLAALLLAGTLALFGDRFGEPVSDEAAVATPAAAVVAAPAQPPRRAPAAQGSARLPVSSAAPCAGSRSPA
jgi:hypothetical protein